MLKLSKEYISGGIMTLSIAIYRINAKELALGLSFIVEENKAIIYIKSIESNNWGEQFSILNMNLPLAIIKRLIAANQAIGLLVEHKPIILNKRKQLITR